MWGDRGQGGEAVCVGLLSLRNVTPGGGGCERWPACVGWQKIWGVEMVMVVVMVERKEGNKRLLRMGVLG